MRCEPGGSAVSPCLRFLNAYLHGVATMDNGDDDDNDDFANV